MSDFEATDKPEDIVPDQQKLKDLEATIAQLQAENASLHTTASKSTSHDNASQFVKNFTEGITQGISQAISTQIKPKSKPTKPESVTIDPDLPQCYHDMQHQVKMDNMGPPISENYSELLEHCWRFPFRKEEIVEILDKQVRPSNVTAVKPLEVNSESDKANEKDLRYIANAVCAAGKCLSYLMDMLAQAEVQLWVDFPEDDGWLVVEDFQFDFPKANKLRTNAMKILGMANVQTSQARRSMLASKFKQEFRCLCDRTNYFEEGMFFSPSLDSAMALVTDANKIQTKAFEQKTFSGRGSRKWGRNRSSPYMSQSQSSQLQAALVQQALAATQPQLSQQVSGVTSGGIFGINQFPQQPAPLMGLGIPLTAFHQGRGRGPRRGFQGKGRGNQNM